jgi:cell fate regulator YaaT (PSP1 superfamily)
MPEFIVRYGVMRFLGVFSCPVGLEVHRGSPVIARTDRGLEAGETLCEASPEAIARLIDPASGQILRVMTTEDTNEQARIVKHSRAELDICQGYVDKLELKMQLVDVEHIFGGERIVIYYLAENRVDFRELVRQLAAEFQTRIEMRQIGVRDEAKLLADFGDCGCTVCCNTYLIEMPPVSMRMAKLQKATLDPTKISGRCGRLKCCLRYEFDIYEDMLKRLPPIGTMVETPEGPAKVIGHEILSGQLQVAMEDHRRMFFQMDQATPIKSNTNTATDIVTPATEIADNPEG